MYPGQHPGDKIAYQMAASGVQITYRELESESNRAAHLFRHCGLKPGDGIAILLENHPRYLQIVWGAQRSGLYFTPISILFQQNEIDYILDNSDAKILITSAAHVSRISPEIMSSLKVFILGSTNEGGFASWEDVVNNYPETRITDESEGAEMIYSSGTTGYPKGVRFPLRGAPLGTVSSLFKTRLKLHQIDETTRYLSTAPLYHSAPLRYNVMVTRMGGTSVIMEKFDPEQVLQLIEKHHITHGQWVPTMFVRMLKLPLSVRQQYDVSSLQFMIHAAAPCPVEIKEQMMAWFGPVVYEYYGGTEANGSTAITPAEWMAHKGSVGRAIHGEIHILDDDLKELPVGEIGTVYFANGSDFSYYKDPEKTRQAKTPDGWSTLGDMGFVDQDGFLYLRDRKSFMIISGGVNIYPQEIENLLVNHPSVSDVAVFGIPHEEFGEEVKAVVQLLNPDDASPGMAETLIAYCREHLSHAKCPRSIDFEAELPRHPTGKLYKRQLRERYWQGRSSRIL